MEASEGMRVWRVMEASEGMRVWRVIWRQVKG